MRGENFDAINLGIAYRARNKRNNDVGVGIRPDVGERLADRRIRTAAGENIEVGQYRLTVDGHVEYAGTHRSKRCLSEVQAHGVISRTSSHGKGVIKRAAAPMPL